MTNKTCGECQWYDDQHLLCVVGGDVEPTDCACDSFIPIKFTNGDKIRQGSDKELVIYKHEWSCHVCIYHDEKNKGCHCRRPNEKTCLDGMIDWLNAPAGSEGKDE